MTTLPLIRDTTPGFTQTLASADTDYAIAIPATARGCILWFEDGSGTIIGGRIGIDQADTSVTVNATSLGYHPPMPVEWTLRDPRYDYDAKEVVRDDRYLHVSSATAGAVVYGTWLYASDNV